MKMLNKPGTQFATLALMVGFLSGCASQPDYGCAIPEACAPVHDNYDKAIGDEDREGWVSEGADPALPPGVEMEDVEENSKQSQADSDDGDDGWFSGWFGDDEEEEEVVTPVQYGETDVHSGPVFVPPRPHRIWLAHWKGNAGELNSGNYTYFTTPGYYLYMGDRYMALPYGADQGSSAASGVTGVPRATFTPVLPGQLGFNAKESEAPQGVLDNMVQPNSGER